MWKVEFCGEFALEYEHLPPAVQTVIAARAHMLRSFGPDLMRPYSDTLHGSMFSNMKELRCPVGAEVWRVAYAFDPKRKAIILAGGNKVGKNQGRFYKALIKLADQRFKRHLDAKES
jgi:hypothetical protein